MFYYIPSIAQAYTETIYVCQGGNGSNPTAGVCATALDDSALSNSSYWDTDVSADGKIGPGDLVLFMDDGGAFTSNMDTYANGSATHTHNIQCRSWRYSYMEWSIRGFNRCKTPVYNNRLR